MRAQAWQGPRSGAGDRQRLGGAAVLALWVAGLAHALSLAWPFAWGLPQGSPSGWLQLLSLAVLARQLQTCASAAQAALAGWLFALAMLAGSFWWLFISMHVYGGLPAPLAVLAVGLLAGFLALYQALGAGLYAALRPRHAVGQALLFAACWLLAELARVRLFTGFPWGQSGYAHVDGWARPLAAWVGVHGLGWLSALVAAAAATCWGLNRWRGRLAGLAALAAASAGLAWLPPPEPVPVPQPPLALTLVQGNIAQDEKFLPGGGIADALRYYGEQLGQAQASLVVLPETAIPLLPGQLEPSYWSALRQRFAQGEQAALIGLPLGSAEQGYTNSVMGLKPGGEPAYRYDKHHLVPFGEFIPPAFHWFVRMMDIPLGSFARGPLAQPSFEWQGQRLAPNICYEDLFGEELGARFRDPQSAPTVFVNLSNIAWFGNTVAIDQHLHISRMRALEFARPMVRATNTGATVVIDAQGQVTHALPRHTRGTLDAQVRGTQGLTAYARWVSVLGLVPWLALGLATCVAAWWMRRRRAA
jgi:apolipoprotein N-acyltransferase